MISFKVAPSRCLDRPSSPQRRIVPFVIPNQFAGIVPDTAHVDPMPVIVGNQYLFLSVFQFPEDVPDYQARLLVMTVENTLSDDVTPFCEIFPGRRIDVHNRMIRIYQNNRLIPAVQKICQNVCFLHIHDLPPHRYPQRRCFFLVLRAGVFVKRKPVIGLGLPDFRGDENVVIADDRVFFMVDSIQQRHPREMIVQTGIQEEEVREPEQISRKMHNLVAGRSEHYAFIIDRSEKGQEMLNRLRNAPLEDSEFRDRAYGVGMKVWEESGYEFVIIWGTFGYTGGLTIPTLDIDNLLYKAIPAVIEKTREKGGECAFFVAVNPAVAPKIEARLAELQPTAGTA
jgi:hypothetical protein